MPSFLQIVTNTPLWVWPLLILVVALGWSDLKPRRVPPLRLAILPLVGLGTSVASLLQSSRPGTALVGWALALLAALPLGHALGRRRAVRALPDGRLEITGGRFMLVFALSIFAVRYGLGVLFGVQPALSAEPLWIALSGAMGGIIAGIGLGWLAGLLLRARWMRRTVWGLASVPLLVVGVFAIVIAGDSPVAVPRLAAGDSLPGSAAWRQDEIPEVRRVAARDGAPLTYRLYPARTDRAVVMIHGLSGASGSMHKLAQALQAEGATVYSISLRGHGGSGWVNGDSSYLGQLDDDLVDFLRATRLADPKIHRTLMGFSSGGGFVLRTAGGANRALFDAYLALSPFIAPDSPTTRPASGGWASVAVPRVVALTILGGFGLPWFQGLPVVRFATAAKADDSRTPVYSFRLAAGMQLGRDWAGALGRIDRPTQVIVGSNDELFDAARFAPLLGELNPAIAVTVHPGAGHMNMIADAAACAAVTRLWQQLAGHTRAAAGEPLTCLGCH